MDDWEISNETPLAEKEDFYSHLNMEDITKELGEHHDLYLQSDTLLQADIFNNFWNMCLEIWA